MFKKIIMKTDFMEDLKNGIVCFAFVPQDSLTGEKQYSFYTCNQEFIDTFPSEDGDGFEELFNSVIDERTTVFDILRREHVDVFFSDFTGEAYTIASLTPPKEGLKLKDASIYLGNKTGAVSVTEQVFQCIQDKDIADLGFKADDGAIVLDTVLAFEKGNDGNGVNLKGIHLVKSSPKGPILEKSGEE